MPTLDPNHFQSLWEIQRGRIPALRSQGALSMASVFQLPRISPKSSSSENDGVKQKERGKGPTTDKSLRHANGKE